MYDGSHITFHCPFLTTQRPFLLKREELNNPKHIFNLFTLSLSHYDLISYSVISVRPMLGHRGRSTCDPYNPS